MTIHELKCDPMPFEDLISGRKRAEIRVNDRDYQRGDMLLFKETRANDRATYTGREARAYIRHIQSGYGLQEGHVCISLSEIGPLDHVDAYFLNHARYKPGSHLTPSPEVKPIDRARLAVPSGREADIDAYLKSDALIRSGMCPNGHGLLVQFPAEHMQRCDECYFTTNVLRDRETPQ